MSIVAEILSSAQGGKLTENLAQSLGITQDQAADAVEALTPALALGLRNVATDPEALEKVLAGVVHPTHQASYEDPAVAHGAEANQLGQAAVVHLFGSESAANEVAQVAARNLGLGPEVVSKLLPVLASVVLGGLFKSFNSQGLGGILGQLAGGGGLGSILGQLAGAAAAPQGGAGAGGLGSILGAALGGGQQGGLLGGLLGAVLGGGSAAPAPAPAPSGGQAPLPGGLDPASLQAAIEQMTHSLSGGPAPQAPHSDLQDVLDKVFPK